MTYHGIRFAALAMALGASVAHAQEMSGEDVAAADALFAEGRRLSDAGRFADACGKFEASMSLLPRLGVQLNLADCYEHVGRTASAWVTFGQAAAQARRSADMREDFARQRQDALVPRLTRLRVLAAHAGIEGFSLTRDRKRIAPSIYGVDVPVDPGTYQIEATAPDHVAWSTQVVASGEGNVVIVEIPRLESAPRPGAVLVSPLTHEVRNDRRGPTRLTWIIAGVGVAGIGVGAALGIAAQSLWQEARADCDPSNNCTDAADARIERSRRDGNLSTVAFGIGGVALATSILLYARGPRRAGSAPHVAPTITPGAVGVAVGGAF